MTAVAEMEAPVETENESDTPVSQAESEAPAPVQASNGQAAPSRNGSYNGTQRELNDSLSSSGETSEHKEVPNGRSYEIIYIVQPNNPEATEQTATRVRGLIEGSGGAVDNVRTSETRRLAYPIKKQIEGVYVVINARFVKDATAEIERFFKLEENVLRHMVIRE